MMKMTPYENKRIKWKWRNKNLIGEENASVSLYFSTYTSFPSPRHPFPFTFCNSPIHLQVSVPLSYILVENIFSTFRRLNLTKSTT